jgi:hypothetical protein
MRTKSLKKNKINNYSWMFQKHDSEVLMGQLKASGKRCCA